MTGRTLAHWLAPKPPALRAAIESLVRACVDIGAAIASATVSASHGESGTRNSHGEAQKKLDLVADAAIGRALADCASVAAWASEERDEPVVSARHGESGEYLVAVDPLDGSASAAANLTVGTIFSILKHPFRGTPPGTAGFLQPGRRQCAAGYALYGPATLLVLTCGDGTAAFARSPVDGVFRLTSAALALPADTRMFAINASNQRFWEKPVQRYVAECLAGSAGPRAADFNMRWVGCMAAEVHRLLVDGGVYLYPRDSREPVQPGRLRLLYEAAPMAWLVEQAGGAAVTGTQALLDIVPDALHEKVAVILGSRSEVERIVRYHSDPSENVHWPLFRDRSLFIAPSP